MSHNLRKLTFILSVFVLVACSQDAAETDTVGISEDNRPNILLIVADDLGWSDIGVNGSEIPTPNLDMLATNGMILSQFYAGMTCSPTRSMIMSGMDNHRAGLGSMGSEEGVVGYSGFLNFQTASLAELLSDAGYNTYMAGKWHLGMEVYNGPHARGFEKSFISLDGAAHLGPWDWRGPQNAQYRENNLKLEVGEDFYSTRVYTEKMIQYISEDHGNGKPFFGWLAYTAPHWPIQAPKESIAKFNGMYDDGYEALYEARFSKQKELGLISDDIEPISKDRFSPRWDDLSDVEKAVQARKMEIYAAMVSDLDSYIGEVIDYLKEIDEFDNTFIMFTSDNGTEPSTMDLSANIQSHVGNEYDHSLENLGSGTSYVNYGPNWASATQTPLNRHKHTGFEGGIRVPAFVYAPGMVPEGTRNNSIGHVMDMMPTFLDLAGMEHPGNMYRGREVLPMQGKSLVPLVTGEVDDVRPNEVVAWELHGHRSVRRGDWKIVWDQSMPEEERRWQMFNLGDDPFEQNDLSQSDPERLQEMVANWDAYVRENGVLVR